MGILLSAPFGPKSVTHVSGTFCYLCLGTDNLPAGHHLTINVTGILTGCTLELELVAVTVIV